MSTQDHPGAAFPIDDGEFASEVPQLPPVSVTEMIERHVALTWPEAVALVAESCHLVVGANPQATHVPEPGRLLVFADGSIRIGPWRGDMDLHTTARTLHALLAGAQPPTPLRLFVGTAISSERPGSVAEFAGSLAYYERPDRAALIRSAYERFQATPLDAPAPAVQEPVAQEPVAKPAPKHRKGPSRLAFAVVFLIVFAAGVTIALRVVSAGQGTVSVPTLESVGARATTELTQLKTKLRDMGLPISVGETAPPEPPQPAAAEVPSGQAPRPVRAPRVPSVAPAAAPVASPAAIEPGPSPAEVARQTIPDEAPQAVVPSAPVSIAADDAAASQDVFSVESVGVSPPVALDRRAMPSNLQVSGTQAVNRMELIIGPDGSVEQVRMLSALERLPDMMLLSGAKSWRFKPAMKDGQPVRFRLPLTWVVSPR